MGPDVEPAPRSTAARVSRNSGAFTPGPHAEKREYDVIRYIERYLRRISGLGTS